MSNGRVFTPAGDASSGLSIAEGDARYSQLGHTHGGLYDPLGTSASGIAAHEAAPDPHGQYLLESEAPALYAASGTYADLGHDHTGVYQPSGNYEASGTVASHEAASDPHGQYLTETEADLLYKPIDAVSFSGISVRTSGTAFIPGITSLTFLGSTVSSLGAGEALISGGGGGEGGGATLLEQLSDVTFAGSPTSGQLLSYNGAIWTNASPSWLTETAADLLYAPLSHNHDSGYEVSGTVEQHATDFNHSLFLTQATADPLYAASGLYELSGSLAAHVAAADPHPQYLLESDASGIYAASGTYADVAHAHDGDYEVSGTVAAHEVAVDPHPQYLTPAEADLAYAASGTYQPAGSYALSGQSYYKAETDARYLKLDASNDPITGSLKIDVDGPTGLRIEQDAIPQDYIQMIAVNGANSVYGWSLRRTSFDHLALQCISGEFESYHYTPLTFDPVLKTLGINETTPERTLDINGTLGIKNILYVSGSSSAGIWIDRLNSDPFVRFDRNSVALGQVRGYDNGLRITNGTGLTDYGMFSASGLWAATVYGNALSYAGQDTDVRYAASGTYADVGHNHDGSYEVSGTFEQHATDFDHSTFLTQATADPLYAASGTYADSSAYLATSGYVDTIVPYSGILVQASGGTLYAGISHLTFLGSTVSNLGGGEVLISGGGGGGGGGATELTNLSDVTLATPSSGQHFIYNGAQWVNGDPTVYETSGTVEQHATDFDHSTFLTQTAADGLYEVSGTTAAHVADAGDPHPQYLTSTEADIAYAASGTYADIGHNHDTVYEVSGTFEQHATDFNHSSFLTAATANTLYEVSGTVEQHTTDFDHSTFLTQATADALYATSGTYADLTAYTATSGYVNTLVSFSGIQVEASGGTTYGGIKFLSFVGSTITNLGAGKVEISGGGGGGGGASELTQLSDVTIDAAISGQHLMYNGAQWVNNPETVYETSGTVEAHATEFNHSAFLTQATADTLYAASGVYELSGTSYTKAESDALYQPTGSYALSGQSYYKAEADARFAASGTYADIAHNHDGTYEVSGTVDAHKADSSDVHTQYLLESAAPALYAASGTYADIAHTHALNDLSDVSVGAAASGQQLNYNGTLWVPETKGTGGSSTLADLTDTAISAPTSGQWLQYNGTDWVNVTVASGRYTEQFSATDSHVVNHNLGDRPQVTVLDQNYIEQFGIGVTHNSVNQLTLDFNGYLLSGVVLCDVPQGGGGGTGGGSGVPSSYTLETQPSASTMHLETIVLVMSGVEYYQISLSGTAGYGWVTLGAGPT